MRIRLFTFLIWLSLVSSGNIFSQELQLYTPEQIREDFQFARESFDKYNPAIGVFHPRNRFDVTYDSLYQTLDEAMTDLEFYPYLARLAGTIREGHTVLGMYSDTTYSIYRGFFDGTFKYLPLALWKMGDTTYVLGNLSGDSTIKRGDEILSINGRTMSEIYELLRAYTQVDGNIKVAQHRQITDAFARFYYWFVERPTSFTIECVNQSTRAVYKSIIPSLPRDSMVYWRNQKYGIPEEVEKSISDIYTFQVDSNFAILDFNSFNNQLRKDYKIKTKKIYKEIFKELKQKEVEFLVIDVRDNTGGRTEYPRDLLPYLLKENRKGIVYDATSWKGKKYKYRIPKRKKNAFSGQIYILTNSRTFSNGSRVAVFGREFGEAIIIGQETASRYEGFAAGSRQDVILPNTKIKVRIPRYVYQAYDSKSKMKLKNRGVIPDYIIEYSLKDARNRKDLEMEKVLELSSTNKEKN